ncbi:MAG: hypothetical protein CSA95_06685 [Bacteroidetes bacterium]|nr:MAG: hypothetical protein CSA95_06685 [Bacteroidota bacterium]
MAHYSSARLNEVFQEAITQYHLLDEVSQAFAKPLYEENSFDYLLYKKCWIDTVQWHLEDIIRDPSINPEEAVHIKRKIDTSNQHRTDLVEAIDDYLYDQFKHKETKTEARINTESPGWALDRLSILNLKLYHWREEALREDASEEHRQKAQNKLHILMAQHDFLSRAIDGLLCDMEKGQVIAQPFKQMKMYNDPETNPVLRALKR